MHPESDPVMNAMNERIHSDMAANPFEQDVNADAIERLYALLQSEELVQDHLLYVASELIAEAKGKKFFDISTYGVPAAEAKTIDDRAWESLIDPSQPTLGLRLHSGLVSPGIVAVAAQRLRSQGERVCNIVILPEIAYANERAGSVYTARRGAIADVNGNIYYGDFPEVLVIDGLSSQGNKRLRYRSPAVRYINPFEDQQTTMNKPQMQAKLREAEIPHIEPLVADVMMHDPRFSATLSEAFQSDRLIAIKPVVGAQGRGVLLVDPRQTTPEILSQSMHDLGLDDEQLMIEPWVRNRAITFPSTGVPAAWTIRALTVDGQPTALYARVGEQGQAVNYCRGSQAWSMQSLIGRYGLGSEEANVFMDRIHDLCRRVGRVALPGATVLGIDIVADEAMEPYVLEVNGERSGGLSTTMNRGTWSAAAWDPAYDTIRRLHDKLFADHAPMTLSEEGENPITIEDVLRGLFYIDAKKFPQQSTQAADIVAAMHHSPHSSVNDMAHQFLALRRDEAPLEVESPDRIVNSLYTAKKLARQRLIAGEADALESLNRYVRADINDRTRHISASLATLQVTEQLHDGSDFSDETLDAIPNMIATIAPSASTAEALGRSLTMLLMDQASTPDASLRMDTIIQIERLLADYLLQPPTVKRAPDATLLSCEAGEQESLADFFSITSLHHIIQYGDISELQALLAEEMQDGVRHTKADAIVSYRLLDGSGHPLASTLVATAHAIRREFADAYQTASRLEPAARQQMEAVIELQCREYAGTLFPEGWGQDADELTKAILNTARAVADSDFETATTAIGKLFAATDKHPVYGSGMSRVVEQLDEHLYRRFPDMYPIL